MPAFPDVIDNLSAKLAPSQGLLSDVVHHEEWLFCLHDGDRPWDATASYGEVTAHTGHYDDCLNAKRNAFHLVVHETTGAFAPGADSFLNKLTHDAEALQAAGGERTVYSTPNENYYTHHSRRISISVRSAVAERAANNHQTLRRRLTRATVIGRQWARGA